MSYRLFVKPNERWITVVEWYADDTPQWDERRMVNEMHYETFNNALMEAYRLSLLLGLDYPVFGRK